MPNRKNTTPKASAGKSTKKVRYAVVGLGYFSQSAILPAFAHAGKNSELVSLVSNDPEKLKKLGRKYKVKSTYSYDQFSDLLASGEVDAVYIALPNDQHKDYAVRAAKAGLHVLVEKPMAVTERDCEEMIRTANEHHVKLMTAYRLHLDAANLKAIETVESGKIGEPRFYNSAFAMQVKEDNIRIKAEHGGGPVYDLGIYCINAARYLFRDEPYEVTAVSSRKKEDPRFNEVDEMVSAILRFPEDRQAAFTCSFGAADIAYYSVVGTKGEICLDQSYDMAFPSTLYTTVGGKTQTKEFAKKDQVAAELIYFSDCALTGKEPEPSGLEGLADVRIIRAIHESAQSGKPVAIERVEKRTRPSKDMEINRPPAEKTELFHADSPTQD
ncbi:MAG: oxidoreductase domain protein [Fibrobacteres bacterium]|nr:oxidoreductase domain protein [Fibrobacterota bacterium]